MDAINKFLRRLPVNAVYLAGLFPVGWIILLTLTGGIGPDPVRDIEQRLGLVALQLLVLCLAVTPLRWLGLNLLKFRRAIGLLAFFYVTMHLITWGVLDMGLRWSQILADLTKRPYVIVGMAAFVTMVPLAISSNNLSIRLLGAASWRRLHWLTYPAILAGAVHFVMLGKVWHWEPLLYLGTVIALLAARIGRGVLRNNWAKRVPSQT
jgi:sulfoxide reductase heme-binding subunit YedZ